MEQQCNLVPDDFQNGGPAVLKSGEDPGDEVEQECTVQPRAGKKREILGKRLCTVEVSQCKTFEKRIEK